jgi:hypothetical protein
MDSFLSQLLDKFLKRLFAELWNLVSLAPGLVIDDGSRIF